MVYRQLPLLMDQNWYFCSTDMVRDWIDGTAN